MSYPYCNSGILQENLTHTENNNSDQSAYIKDTIAAIATGKGAAGIGIVRISGPDSLKIAEYITQIKLQPNIAKYCNFIDLKKTVDYGIAIYFKSPNSFTGEDVVELQGHGGSVVLNNVLNIIIKNGARLAEPGEFSKRAYLNNKIDLLQAESILDLIHANTEEAAAAAINSLSGDFSLLITKLLKSLIKLRMFVEAAIDFPEEEIDFLQESNIVQDLNEIITTTVNIKKVAKQGVLLIDGVDTVILGRPNVGKSSLLNVLSGENTAIVTDLPGTTRDIVSADINIDGVVLHIKDTAGLRESTDIIEQEGIKKAKKAANNAQLILFMYDATSLLDGSAIKQEISNYTGKKIIVINKIDTIPDSLMLEHKQNLVDKIKLNNIKVVYISATNKTGIDNLKQEIQAITGVAGNTSTTFSARKRHLVILEKVVDHLNRGKMQLEENKSGELLAEELKYAQQKLSEITGEFCADDLLGEIFSQFCIGK